MNGMEINGNQSMQLDFLLNFKDSKQNDDFFEFTLDKKPSVGIILVSALFGGIFFPFQSTALSFNNTWGQWLLTFILLVVSLTTSITGFWLSFLQLELKWNHLFKSTYHGIIPRLQACFIVSSTLYLVLLPCILLYTADCELFPSAVGNFLCTSHSKISFYGLLMAVSFAPVLSIVCLREARLYLILSPVMVQTVCFVAYAAMNASEMCLLFGAWGILIGVSRQRTAPHDWQCGS